MDGKSFLLLYIVLLPVAVLLSMLATRNARPEGCVDASPTPETLAWLAGGRQRLVDALVTRALATGELTLTDRKPLAHADGTPATWSAVSRKYERRGDALQRKLVRNGQLMDAEALRRLRRRALIPFAALLTLGTARLLYGIAVERPVGFLAALLVLTCVVALIRAASINQQTEGGRETLHRAQTSHVRLRRAPRANEMDLGVALFGTAVLAGSAHAGYHQYRTASDGSGGSDGSSDSGSDGGGGCGGGGCGGCGGGGD